MKAIGYSDFVTMAENKILLVGLMNALNSGGGKKDKDLSSDSH